MSKMGSFIVGDLPSLPLAERHRLPNVSAVYFVRHNNGKILYVGVAASLVSRWTTHSLSVLLRPTEDQIVIAWLRVPMAERYQIEAALIWYFQPPLNIRRVRARKLNATTKTIAFRVPLLIAEALETQAAKERRTLSNYLNGVIEKHVKMLERQRKAGRVKRDNGK